MGENMRVGIDVDGVLADFNPVYINTVIKVTGRDLFPPRPFEIRTWDYPESYGYTKEEITAVWKAITADRWFWQDLPEYDTTERDILHLAQLMCDKANDFYFITSRPGLEAKRQTEAWLTNRFDRYALAYPRFTPTVLISSAKGMCASALKLDRYIDDRDVNVCDVKEATFSYTTLGPTCRAYLLDRSWNQNLTWNDRITALPEMFA